MRAEDAITRYEEVSHTLREARAALYDAQDAARDLRLAALTSLIGNANPETGKPHSRTSAAEAARDLPEVRQADLRVRAAEVLVEQWESAVRAQWLRAQLEIKLAGVDVG